MANVLDLSLTATNIVYDNGSSGLRATNVQTAIDELNVINSEVLVVNLSTNNSTPVTGSVIFVEDNTDTTKSQSYTIKSGETSHSFVLMANHSFTVSVSSKTGFDSPTPMSFVSIGGATRSLSLQYLVWFVYGYKIEKENGNPDMRVIYTNDSLNFISAGMNYNANRWIWGSWESFVKEYFRPCMLNFDGTVAYYLDPNDQTKKADGTPSDVSNINFGGNAMVEVKKLYLYEYADANFSYHMVSSHKIDSNYVAYPFTNANGTEKNFAYFPMFEGSLDSQGKMRSIAGRTISASMGGQQQIDAVNLNGEGYYTDYWSAHNFMVVMHTLIGKSTNSQVVFGQGVTRTNVSIQTGTLKSSGGFFGYSNRLNAVKTFWMENNWGNVYKKCMGIVTDASSNMLVKMTAPYNSTGSGYTNLGTTSSTDGYIKYISTTNNGYRPIDTNGSSTSFFCDSFFKKPNCYGMVSGFWASNVGAGCFFLNISDPFSYTDTYYGCRLFFVSP
ncbi:MAG: hypothetical protein RR322_02820 [Oscillospiraceae bacterium]